jgi:hypothetical protein
MECGGRDAALDLRRESQSGVGATALHIASDAAHYLETMLKPRRC